MASSLLLIPDISGFTEFVHQTDITHSQHIITELLEVIIDSNELGLEISEVEGDAVLFYKENEVPELQSLIDQTEKMFTSFHQHLRLYDTRRICQCGACTSASGLSLKIIAHAGKIGFTNVKDHKKPFGPELVLVYTLLKNSIEENEYLLLSNYFDGAVKDSKIQFIEGSTSYEKLGEQRFHYFPLASYKKNLEELPLIPRIKKTSDPISFEGMIEQSVDVVYEVISNLDYRLQWSEGINELKYDKDRVNRIGTKHVCVFNSGTAEFETIRSDFDKDTVVYGEKINNFPLAKDLSLYYILSKSDEECKIRIEIHYNPNLIGKIARPFIRRRLNKTAKKSFKLLKQFCESIPFNIKDTLIE